MAIPKSRSPVKTHLKSPAVRNPRLRQSSSPARGSNVASDPPSDPHSVNRRLDFGKRSRLQPQPTTNGLTTPEEVGGEDEYDGDDGDAPPSPAADETIDSVDYDEDAEEAVAMTTSRRRPRPARAEESESPEREAEAPTQGPRRKRGRRPKHKEKEVARDAEDAEEEEEDEEEEEPEPKRQRRVAKGKRKEEAAPEPATNGESSRHVPKRRGRKRASAGEADTSVVVPRGPPLPKRAGLVINRREVPGVGSTTRTRSGRTSFKPLAFWRNEHVDYNQDEVVDDAFAPKHKDSRFVLPAIKEIHRVDEPEAPSKSKPGRRGKAAGGGKGPKRQPHGSDEDDDNPVADPWELEEGEVHGQVLVWDPYWEISPPDEEEIQHETELIAMSHEQAKTRAVRGAEFGFAKTLNMGFLGAGVIDMPPGSVKRHKNSRGMHLVFFVFTGRVRVEVNETDFRISKGGMWFVPRGKFDRHPFPFLSFPLPGYTRERLRAVG